MKANIVHAALFGVAVGDALGVPVEFTSRSTLQANPVVDFEGYKSHNQPPGTFSDDSSLTFCLAESLCRGYDLEDIATRFLMWRDEDYWTAHGEVFDIGNTTHYALNNLKNGIPPALSGGFEEGENGNGSLMRILPLAFYIRQFDIEKRYAITKEVSSITHGHIQSVVSCFYYLEFALELLKGNSKQTAYQNTAGTVLDFITNKGIDQRQINLFAPLLKEDISRLPLTNISSSGYVVSTLKAAVYCVLTTSSYKEAVIKAVNMGDDTDTTAAVAGGLAGLYYGFESIPEKWRNELARSNDIYDLCTRLAAAMNL